jgi:hypothetical protein
MQTMPDFVRDEGEEEPVRRVASTSLTGWETVIFQVVPEPETEPASGSDSDLSTAAFAP